MKLSKTMTVDQFDRGYWYATELKAFAETLGIAKASRLRKDEIEKSIRAFLSTGTLVAPTKRSLSKTGVRDIDRGLSLDLRVVLYTSNRETKKFLEREAQKIAPGSKRRSGARYRLNRWREEQLTRGKKITYRDLVKAYVRFNSPEEKFSRIPSGRYINFLSDFLKYEKGATHASARAAWKKLKSLDIPKNYESWKNR